MEEERLDALVGGIIRTIAGVVLLSMLGFGCYRCIKPIEGVVVNEDRYQYKFRDLTWELVIKGNDGDIFSRYYEDSNAKLNYFDSLINMGDTVLVHSNFYNFFIIKEFPKKKVGGVK